jgi:hypothetical protein
MYDTILWYERISTLATYQILVHMFMWYFTYQKFCETVQLWFSCSLPSSRTGGKETQAAESQTENITANIRLGDDDPEYSKGRVMAWYRSSEIAHRFKIDAVHDKTSAVKRQKITLLKIFSRLINRCKRQKQLAM